MKPQQTPAPAAPAQAPAKEQLTADDRKHDEELAKKFMLTRATNMEEFAKYEVKGVEQSVK